jgi:hypothetical protein
VPRPAGWLEAVEVARPTIYEESRSATGSAYDSSRHQDAVLGTMWPVSILDAASPAAVAHVVRAEDPACLQEALQALRTASLDVEERAFFVLCEEATEPMRQAALRPDLREEVHLLVRGAPLAGGYGRLLGRPGLTLRGWTLAADRLAPARAAELLADFIERAPVSRGARAPSAIA